MAPHLVPPTTRPRRTPRLSDARGDAISGATPAAVAAYERAFAAFQGWRVGADAALALTLQQAPGFTMAHVLQAWMLLGSRDPRQVAAARPVLARAAGLAANGREQAHLAAITTLLADDFDGARVRLGELLRDHPRDALALQMAHALDHLTGDVAAMRERVAGVLAAWSNELPGHSTILAMQAFSLEECGEYDRAEQVALAALALNPAEARAHHVMAHVFEMTERADAGVRWLTAHQSHWGIDTTVAVHCWWHLALFHLRQGESDRALALFDRRVRATGPGPIGDLIDAAALLWRLRLLGVDAGARWRELAAAWSTHVDDAFCTFNDLHAMLAFVGAGDGAQAGRLIASLERAQMRPTRHGATTRRIGLPACRGLLAFGRGDDTLAVTLLASLPAAAHRIGGSHAQRDVLRLTVAGAAQRLAARSRAGRSTHCSSTPAFFTSAAYFASSERKNCAA
jgi:tetratricopeptide (TPR) repeat protein